MFSVFRRWPVLRRAAVSFFALPLMFAGGSLVGGLQQSVGGVGSFEIPRQEYAAVYRRLEEEFRRQYRSASVPSEYAPQISRQAQTQLTREYLIRAAVADRQIDTSNDAVIAEIRRIPDFQDESGSFSISLFNEFVPNERELVNNVRRTLERRPLLAALKNYPITKVREKLAAYRRQQRIVETAVISVTARFNITEDAIRRYYSANQNVYAIREEADWEYIIVGSEQFAAEPDAETAALARQELDEEFAAAEQRTARHIYIAGEDDDAKARAEEIAVRARAAPDSFADLAREFSEDEGSAENGGSLGLAVRGDLPEAMDAVLFSLEDGEIGGPVAVDGGFSILKMDSSSAPPPENIGELAAVRARQMTARDNLAAALERLQETAHINVGSLSEVAAEAGVGAQTARAVPSAPGAEDSPPEFFLDREIIAQLYTEEILSGGETSPPIVIDDDTYLMARALRHQPASARPLAEVAEEIRLLLNAREQIVKMRSAKDGIALPESLVWEGNYTLNLTGGAPEELGEGAVNAVFAADLTGGTPAHALLADAGKIRAFRIASAADLPPREEDFEVISDLLKEAAEAANANAYLETLLNIYDVHFQQL